jgi:hypothetical protein
MTATYFLDPVPLWLLYLISITVVLLSIELGWRLGNYRRQYSEKENQAPINAAVGATLGLLAFLLAFTFSMAASRFDTRKQIVLQEANAIGTTYLRAEFLENDARNEVQNLLREYTELRSRGAQKVMSPEGMEKSSLLLDKLWAVATSSEATSDTYATGLFIQSLNEVIYLDTIRITALRNRIPDSIWFMLGVVTILAMISMGFEFGLTGVRSWVVTVLLAVAFTTVLILITDLDRSWAGSVQVRQQPLIDLLNKIGTPVP